MFLDILELIFDNFEGVVRAFDIPLFSVGTVDISFWELLLGIFTVSVIFGFFLAPRPGSVLASAGNYNEWNKSKEAAKRQAEEKSNSESYDEYANRRARNEWYGRKYNAERGRSNE